MQGGQAASDDRRKALKPYLDCLRPPLPPWVQGLGFEAWELEIVRRAAEGDHDLYSAVLIECAALQAKSLSELDALKQPDLEKQTARAVRRGLEEDAAIGTALMDELQQAINLLVLDGQIDSAKKLTAFRGRMNRNVAHLKETIGSVATQRADAVAPSLIRRIDRNRPARTPDPETLNQIENARFKPRPRPDAAPAESSAPRPATPFDWGTLVGWLTWPWLWAALALPIALFVAGLFFFSEPPLPDLGQADFGSIPDISSVLTQKPHVFLTVTQARWSALSSGERQQLIDRVAEVARGAGYRGAHITTAGGQLAAQWRAETGTRLF